MSDIENVNVEEHIIDKLNGEDSVFDSNYLLFAEVDSEVFLKDTIEDGRYPEGHSHPYRRWIDAWTELAVILEQTVREGSDE